MNPDRFKKEVAAEERKKNNRLRNPYKIGTEVDDKYDYRNDGMIPYGTNPGDELILAIPVMEEKEDSMGKTTQALNGGDPYSDNQFYE